MKEMHVQVIGVFPDHVQFLCVLCDKLSFFDIAYQQVAITEKEGDEEKAVEKGK